MGAPKYLLSVGSATLTTVPSMMFMNIAATNTALTTTFGLAARPGRANFTNYSSAPDSDLFPRRTKIRIYRTGPGDSECSGYLSALAALRRRGPIRPRRKPAAHRQI